VLEEFIVKVFIKAMFKFSVGGDPLYGVGQVHFTSHNHFLRLLSRQLNFNDLKFHIVSEFSQN